MSDTGELALEVTESRTMELPLGKPEAVSAYTAAAIEKARVLAVGRFELAKRFPRAWNEVEAACLSEISLDKKLPIEALYSKPIGNGKTVEGPSIRLAEVLFRAVGHMDAEVTVPEETLHHRRVAVSLIDYQTGAVRTQDFIISKTVERKKPADRRVLASRRNSFGETVYEVEATEDEMLVKQGAMAAKVRRNLIVEFTPRWLLSNVLEACAKAAKGKAKGLFELYAEQGITKEEIFGAFGLDGDAKKLPEATLSKLRAILGAIKDGEITWKQVVAEANAKRAKVAGGGVAPAGDAVREKLGIEREPGEE